MGKKPAAQQQQAAKAAASNGRRSFLPSARTRRKVLKYLAWVLGPLLAAAAVAYVGAPENDAPVSPDTNPFADDEVQAPADDRWSTDGAPPMDTWTNPGECQAWAGGGECKNNPTFMKQNCAFSCAKLDYARARYYKRCPKPKNYTEALSAGQMAGTFARIMSDFSELEPEQISVDPPVILFHNFLSDVEADAFIKHGKGRYEKSLGVGMKADGTMGDVPTEIRTSSHGWCQHPACLNDPHVQAVVARVADITQVPSTNAEFAQLVYYHACDEAKGEKCAFYRRHSDYIEGDEHKLPGVRIYTLFTYLNDVEGGGGTRFTDLPNGPVTFQPQRKKAILWPSVLADQPHTKDDRTHHEALPVTAGEKYGANFWIHQYDFKGPHSKGCTV